MKDEPQTPEMEPADQLTWMALRYVLGELTTEETAAFEIRLSNELAVAEAVAQSIEIAASVQHVEQMAVSLRSVHQLTPVCSTTPWLQVAPWLFAGAALSVAVMVSAQLWLANNSMARVGDLRSGESAAVAIRWGSRTLQHAAIQQQAADPTSVMAEQPWSESSTDEDTLTSLDALDSELGEEPLVDDHVAPRAVPAWMLQLTERNAKNANQPTDI